MPVNPTDTKDRLGANTNIISSTDGEDTVRISRNNGTRKNLKYVKYAEIRPGDSLGEKADKRELKRILDEIGGNMTYDHTQSTSCTRYKCKTHKNCSFYGRIYLETSGPQHYWCLGISGQHATKELEESTHGIHPIFYEEVDKLIENGLTSKNIWHMLRENVLRSNPSLENLLPTTSQITARKNYHSKRFISGFNSMLQFWLTLSPLYF